MHSIIAVRGRAMAAHVVQGPDRRWIATTTRSLVAPLGEGDTPEEASDDLADRIKAEG